MSGYQGNIIIKNPATPTGPAENGSAPGVWTLSEALAFKRQGVWPTQGVIPADPYFNYVSMLLSTTSLGNANNNLFVDSSGAFIPLSRNGNTTQGSVTPYSPNWSNYFDGNGDNLTLPSSASYAIASSSTPFTVEAWIYPTAGGGCVFSEAFTGSGSIPIVISMSTGTSVDGLGGLYIGFGWYTGAVWVTAAIASSAVTANTWTHIACVFTGSTTKIYYNGVDVTKPSSPTPASSWGVTGVAGDSWYIGRRWDGAGSNWFSGYISNLRFVNGTAVYTANFTPPTAPLTAIANTVLLTCQSNRFRDTSAGNATITVVGDTRVTDFSPFSPGSAISYDQSDITNWSGYFDGSGDYLSVPDNAALDFETGDFTVEMWVYFPSTVSSNNALIAGWTTGEPVSGWVVGADATGFYFVSAVSTVYSTTAVNTAARTPGVWHHVAVVRSSGSVTVYVNGVGGTPVSNTQNITTAATGLNIGRSPYTANPSPFTGYISNLRMVKGTAVYTGNFTPPTTNLTAISGTSLLTLQNAAFTDNSTNNFVITPFGNTTVTGNSPFNTVGYWSNYLDNSGDYLTTGSGSSAFAFGTGDFTIEGWFYANTAVANWKPMISVGAAAQGQLIRINQGLQFTGNWGMLYPNDAGNSDVYFDTGSPFPLNQWVHVALVRNGSTLTLYQNGVNVLQKTVGFNFTNTTGVAIGYGQYAGDGFFGGYVSNIRIVKGTAVYTANFTPSTTPLTAITNTSLLTCQNGRFIDNSTNAFTITANGNTSVQSFDPFYTSTIASNGGSMYFDGSGDFITAVSPSFAFGTGSWTVEFWIYPLAYSGSVVGGQIFGTVNGSQSGYSIALGQDINNFRLISNASGSWADNLSAGAGNGPPLNAWTHMVVVRSGANISIYKNGTRVSTTASATSWNFSGTTAVIGRFNEGTNLRDLNGYLSNLRVTGAAVYDPTQSTISVPTAPVNPIANTVIMPNGMNAGIYDATAINDVETVGNAQVRFPSPFAPANYWAGAFDGSGDFLSVASNAAFDLGSSDFTVECWFNANSFAAGFGLISRYNYTSVGLGWLITIQNSTTVRFVRGNDIILDCTVSAMSTGTWYHVAAVRNGSTLTVYLNGTQVGQSTGISNFSDAATALQIGRTNTVTNDINGYISNARVVKGTAVYTSAFTPSTTPLTAIANTSLLTLQNKTFIDNSANAFTITANGNATAGAIGPFTATGGTSMYFDGSGDYLVAANQPTLNFGTGDFTIEMWINFSSFTGSIGVLGKRASEMNYSPIVLEGSGNTLRLYMSTTGSSWQVSALSTGTLSTGVWYHYAVSRSGSTVYAFVNGVSVGSTGTASGPLMTNTDPMTIGQASVSISASVPLNGYIDDFRITNGYARYTSNFTPPTQPFVTY